MSAPFWAEQSFITPDKELFMSRRFPRVTPAVVGILASLVAGCAAPTQLSFGDQVDTAGTQILLDNSTSAVQSVDVSVDGGFDASGAGAATVNDVEAALTTLLTTWVDCFHAPADCEPNPITAPDSPERARLAEAAAFYATERIRTRPDEGRLEWGVEAVSLTGDNRARVVACEYDTRVFFDSSMADTELGDIIFDTTIWTRRVEWTLARHDGDWKLWSRRIDRRSPVARFCTP